jgi:hypothetical protein
MRMVEVSLPGIKRLETVHHGSIVTIGSLSRRLAIRSGFGDVERFTEVKTTNIKQMYVFLMPGFVYQVILGNSRPASSKCVLWFTMVTGIVEVKVL